jgi:hypothetical protein
MDKKIFKSSSPVKYTHERGIDIDNIEGTVIRIEGNRVYLKGLFCDFSISKSDFLKKNSK